MIRWCASGVPSFVVVGQEVAVVSVGMLRVLGRSFGREDLLAGEGRVFFMRVGYSRYLRSMFYARGYAPHGFSDLVKCAVCSS